VGKGGEGKFPQQRKVGGRNFFKGPWLPIFSERHWVRRLFFGREIPFLTEFRPNSFLLSSLPG